MIQVTHILPSTGLGGIQKNLLFKSKYDKEYNIKRKVICIIRDYGELEENFHKAGIEVVNCLILPTDHNYRPYRLFKLLRKAASPFFVFKLYYALKKDKSAIIHSEDSTKLITQLIITLITRKKFIWQLHTNYEVIKTDIIKNILYFLIKRKKIELFADSYAAVDANVKKLSHQKYLFHLVSPGIDLEKFSINKINKNKIRKQYGIDNKIILLGSTGRLHESKGFEILINSFNEVIKSKDLKCKLLIAGEGPLRENLTKLINKLNLSEHIILLGRIFNIEEFLCILDYYIQSSVNEGFPLAAIEALAARVPMVSTDAGGLPELIKDGESGIIVNNNSVSSLTHGITKILGKTEVERDLMIKNGYHTACRYSTKIAVEKDVLIYKSLLNIA